MKKFVTNNIVRMHDTDMAGILYFARQFRFVHDAMEDYFSKYGVSFHTVTRDKEYMFVIVHAESDYKVSLHVGDKIEVHLSVSEIGQSSFTFYYEIFREDGTMTGTAKTVHVCINPETRKKMAITPSLQKILSHAYSGEKT